MTHDGINPVIIRHEPPEPQLPTIGHHAGWKISIANLVGVCFVGSGVSSVLLAFWEALGINGSGCGSAFRPSYLGSLGDPYADPGYCFQQSPHYRNIAFVLGGIGLGLVLAGAFATRRRTLRTVADIMVPPNRADIVTGTIHAVGVVAAVMTAALLIVGGLDILLNTAP